MSAAREFTAQRFGALTQARQYSVTVGSVSQAVRAANPNALGILITNTGANAVTLSYGTPVVAGAGMLLLNNGSTFYSVAQFDGDVVGWRIYGISVLGTTVDVVEIEEVTKTPAGAL